jgi:hypothetical protein
MIELERIFAKGIISSIMEKELGSVEGQARVEEGEKSCCATEQSSQGSPVSRQSLR